ncbi:MAG: PAS-domain containing protein [Euryarchaeota archaeon]|nr:PAS-domain containing protein [Euryarchaeota archaeon]
MGFLREASEATREKAFAAEHRLAGIRAAIIALNIAVFFGLMDKTGSVLWLAYAVSAVAIPYALFVLLVRPYKRYPVLISASFTSVTDAVLITLWLAGTGGYESPFYVLWYVSLAAVAFRFDYGTTLAVSALYAGTYLALLVALGDFVAHFPIVIIRLAYIFFVGMIGALFSKETLEQTEQKLEMRDLAVKTQRQAKEIAERESQLLQTVSLLNATLDSTADGILVVDTNNKITSFNKKFVEMWRVPAEIIASRDDERAIGFVLDQLKEPQAFVAKIKELYANPAARSRDELAFKDGRIFERYSQPQTIGGQAVGRVWSFRDVTAERKAEAEHLEAVAQAKEVQRLKELDQFKTQFMNSVAHELWTPLTPIKIQLHMLRTQKAEGLNETQRQSIAMIDRNLDRLSQLVEEMLDSARLQAGRFRVNRVPMNLAPVVTEMVELFRLPAESAGLTLTADVAPTLAIEGDSNRLIQVLYNLLSNAVKFTPAGGTVRIHAWPESGFANVEVGDSGLGMRPDQLARLFQAFSQAHDKMQQTRSGTGLGLYITRAIVEAHDGTIKAESAGEGRGSTFAFRVPLSRGPIAVGAASASRVSAPAAPPSTS